MDVGDTHPQIPHVTDDDFLATLFESDQERWHEIATSQPELAREIEQRANQLRRELEDGRLSSIDFQREVIDFGTFIIAAIRHAIETQKIKDGQTPPSEDTDPPLSV